jgi:hypothetical protein
MALEFGHGAIQWLTATAIGGTYTVSSLTFQPKALRFYWVGLQSNPPTNASSQVISERRGVGFAVSTTQRRCVGTFSDDASAASDTGSVAGNTEVVITVGDTANITGRLDITSFTSTGFVLTVDQVAPANITVFWEAWGGDDITVATVGDIAEPAATGTQNYTVTGFTTDGRDQVVMFAGIQATAAVGTAQAQDSGLSVGFTCNSSNITVCGNSDDASGTMDTDGYCREGECLSMITIAGGNPNSRATRSAWGTDFFTLNWITRATTNRRNIFMAIKGGSWRCGSYTIAGATLNATASVSDLWFNPIGVSLVGRMTEQQAAGLSSVQDRIGFGTATSPTSRNSAGVLDVDNIPNSNITTIVQYDSILSFPSTTGTVQAKYDLNNINAAGFQVIVDVAGGVASEFQGYLTFGSKRIPRISSVGHPFIM